MLKCQIVKEAPEATLSASTGDVATTGGSSRDSAWLLSQRACVAQGEAHAAGLCATDVETFCASVKPGELRLSLCLSNQLAEEEKGNVEGGQPGSQRAEQANTS